MEERRVRGRGRREGGTSAGFEEGRSAGFEKWVDGEGSLRKGSGTTAVEMGGVGGEGLRRREERGLGGAAGGGAGGAGAGAGAEERFAGSGHEEASGKARGAASQAACGSCAPLLPAERPVLRLERVGAAGVAEELHESSGDRQGEMTPTASTPGATSWGGASERAEERTPLDYWAVNEWAESAESAFYEPLDRRTRGSGEMGGARDAVGAGLGDAGSEGGGATFSHVGSESDLDVLSEAGDGVATPGSWTEVGSLVSGGD